jgi:hypothetical protein
VESVWERAPEGILRPPRNKVGMLLEKVAMLYSRSLPALSTGIPGKELRRTLYSPLPGGGSEASLAQGNHITDLVVEVLVARILPILPRGPG